MNMKPHYEFVQDRNYKDIIVVKFSNGLMAAFGDQYCTNPACDCAGVSLQFNEVDESRNLKEELFSFTMDTNTWEVSKIKMENENSVYEGLIKEFVTDMGTSLKERFRTLLKKAKECGKDEVMDWFDDLNIVDGSCFGYSEVYGESDTENFMFEYKDQTYFVDDQYCTTPKCKCNEVVLSFINIIPGRDQQEAQFVLRVPLGTGDYEIEFSNSIDLDEIKRIFTRYMEHIHDMGLMRNRYTKMKEFGKKRIMRQKQTQDTQKVVSLKVGRNDPCLCGSGKKYKKCCGIQEK